MEGKRVVVVLGSGRSGTSLVMQVLQGLGMFVSECMNEASVANPNEPFEDKEIFDLQSLLVNQLGSSASIPLPEDWLEEKVAISALSLLENIIRNRTEGAKGIFGFKDPKTSIFLPLWIKVFNKLKLVPKYVLAVRNPNATVASFAKQYGHPPHMAELVLLVRLVEALESTGGDCFIVHYEDWFFDPERIANSLSEYTGLQSTFKGNLFETVTNTIKLNLSRTDPDSYNIRNPYLIKLFEVLNECRGADFDHNRLMDVVKECRSVMDGFKGWYELAHKAKIKLLVTQERVSVISAKAAKVKELETRIQILKNEKALNAELARWVERFKLQLNSLMKLED